MNDYQIREMTAGEVELAVEWAAVEGWNPGLNDAACFYAADSGGFLLGLLDGEPVAVISAVRYGEAFGFVGFYIVAPAMRGRGYGLRLWQAAMERLRGRTLGLDGVVAQQANYQKSGFRYAHRNVRYEGRGGRVVDGVDGVAGDGEVIELSSVALDEVKRYDRAFFPADRARFLDAWLKQPGGASLGVCARGRLAGYGVLRPCRVGYKIGPLFADTPAVADALYAALCARAQHGAPVYLDIPEPNPQALELTRRHRMKAVFETARMYAGAFPPPPDKVFGITTFELG